MQKNNYTDIQATITQHYYNYLQLLKQLASMPTVFTHLHDVKKSILWCKKILEQNLSNYDIYIDAAHNLIAIPQQINLQKNIVYLSAHIDTVDAIVSEWDPPFHPWQIVENDTEIVGRGVSDCKAGVAFQLWLSHLIHNKICTLENLIFTITYKEEGLGIKTATEIGKKLGSQLPLSNLKTYCIVLENTVLLQSPQNYIDIYGDERSNFIIQVESSLEQLKNILHQLPKWNPVYIHPVTIQDNDIPYKIYNQIGGHSCSIGREDNILSSIILNAQNYSQIKAGDQEQISIVPSKIYVQETKEKHIHTMILNNRITDNEDSIIEQLQGISYTTLKPFDSSQGMKMAHKIQEDDIFKIIQQAATHTSLSLRLKDNIGSSDGSIIFRSSNKTAREKLCIMVIGPGTRSHVSNGLHRKTHGKNETFHKQSGQEAIYILLETLLAIC